MAKQITVKGRVDLPLAPRAWPLIGGLALSVAIAAAAVWVGADVLDLLKRVHEGGRVPYAEVEQLDHRLVAVGNAQLGVALLTAIAWLTWQSLAYRKELAIGIREARFPTRDAILWWFIPILQLIRPKAIMDDIWRGSDPGFRGHEPNFARRPVDFLLHLWWVVWVCSAIVDRYTLVKYHDQVTSYEQARNLIKLLMVANLGVMLAGALAIIVVKRITERVEERWDRFPPQAAYAAAPVLPGHYAAGAAQYPASATSYGAGPASSAGASEATSGSVPPPGYG